MRNIRKQKQYDEFTCIADRCKFTCCSGWEVNVDKDTVALWKSGEDNAGDVNKSLRPRKKGKNTEYVIRMGQDKRCPFLNEVGLCKVVITQGESALPRTCRTFPRIINSLEDEEEYSLSLACPVVTDMVYQMEGQLEFQVECEALDASGVECKALEDSGVECKALEDSGVIRLRSAMINLLQHRSYSLQDRILMTFHMLVSCKNEVEYAEHVSEEDEILDAVTEKYNSPEFQAALINAWSGLEDGSLDALCEVNELFLDITQNYKREKLYKAYLQEICHLAEEIDIEESIIEWKSFQPLFGQLDSFLENCIVSKVFSSCISEDMEELILSFQMVITEYAMVRYSTFLCWLRDKRVPFIKDKNNGSINIGSMDHNYNDISVYYPEIKDYIVSYSRIIGYNCEGMKEFWKDSFEEAIWELGYVLLLVK